MMIPGVVLTDFLGRRMVEPPPCPHHGRGSMHSMESVGAPEWFTCAAASMGPGGICGHSAHGGEA